jgi:hypothetical protein
VSVGPGLGTVEAEQLSGGIQLGSASQFESKVFVKRNIYRIRRFEISAGGVEVAI